MRVTVDGIDCKDDQISFSFFLQLKERTWDRFTWFGEDLGWIVDVL